MKIHPEAKEAINRKFQQLSIQFPEKSLRRRYDLAVWLVKEVARANTAIFFAENISIIK